MKKKRLQGKRLLALALVFSMLLSEVAFAMPKEAAASEDAGEPSGEEATEAVSDNDAAGEDLAQPAGDDETTADGAETGSEELIYETGEGEETAGGEAASEEEELLDAQTAKDGSVSKVIGLKARASYYSFTDDYGWEVLSYIYANTSRPILVKGKVAQDSQSGLYTYGGKLYADAEYDEGRNVSFLYTGKEVAVCGPMDSYLENETGLYRINDKRYSKACFDSNEVNGADVYYYYPNRFVEMFNERTDGNSGKSLLVIRQKTGKYVNHHKIDDPDELCRSYAPDYYVINGTAYRDIDYVRGSDGKYTWYASESERIVFDRDHVTLSWNYLTQATSDTYDPARPKSQIAYEIMVNDSIYDYAMEYALDASKKEHYLTGISSHTLYLPLADTDKLKIKVRGVYYHEESYSKKLADGSLSGSTYWVVDSVGPWSDELNYAAAKTPVPQVSGLSAKKLAGFDDQVQVKWNPVKECASYSFYKIDSKKPLNITAANFYDYFDQKSATLKAAGISKEDYRTFSYTGMRKPEYTTGYEPGYFYHYYAVFPYGVADPSLYRNLMGLEKSTVTSLQTAATPEVYAPALSGVKLEKRADGKYNLVWNKVNAKVVIYAYDSQSFPALYQYKAFGDSVQRILKDEKGAETANMVSMSTDRQGYSYKDPVLDADVRSFSNSEINSYNKLCGKANVDGSAGVVEDILNLLNLTYGRTYYLVMHSYDSSENYKKERKETPLTYSYTGRYYKDGAMQTTTVKAEYVYYPTLGPASKVLKLKQEAPKPDVYTYPSKSGIKFFMQRGMGTGFEIYRKVGKKYKKIAVTTDNVYVDEKLKSGKKYAYKVRSYRYDRDTKKTYYSAYRKLEAKTFAEEPMVLKAVQGSKNSVKLKWSKVSGATKYEIYRLDNDNWDLTLMSGKYSASGSKAYLSSSGYKLVKTIAKAKTTSYTDKKLSAEQSYHYYVLAYHKEGSATQMQIAGAGVTMDIVAPTNVYAETDGKKVTLTWDPDKYAKGFEVSYFIQDEWDNKTASQETVKVTSKTKYVISGLKTGWHVSDIRVRAFNKNKEYSSWTNVGSTYDVSMAPVKSIKAQAVVTKDGKKAVKISWKKVAGAKYYKVYRSTTNGTYDADRKLYWFPDSTNIVKECNDNYAVNTALSSPFGGYRSSAEIVYREYMDVNGSIVSTTAYDYADLPAGVTYYYMVQAFGEVPTGGNDSCYSSAYCTEPAKVVVNDGMSSIKASSKKGKVTLKWESMKDASVKYTIYRSAKEKGKYKKVGTAKKASFTDKTSKKGKTYYYKIAAVGTNALKADVDFMSKAVKVKAK